MSRKNEKRKLVVKRETLRQLAPDDLEQVQGGAVPNWKNNCTARLSGCISMI
jgi:hypothetical protein